jgi:hypothetical protein
VAKELDAPEFGAEAGVERAPPSYTTSGIAALSGGGRAWCRAFPSADRWADRDLSAGNRTSRRSRFRSILADGQRECRRLPRSGMDGHNAASSHGTCPKEQRSGPRQAAPHRHGVDAPRRTAVGPDRTPVGADVAGSRVSRRLRRATPSASSRTPRAW